MASKITLKNLEQQEFTIQHPDGVGAGTIKSTDITYKIDSVDDFTTVPDMVDTVIVKDKDRGGVFNKIASTTANGGTIFDGNGCSWERQYSGAVNVKWFGAVGDGITDDTDAIQSASLLFKELLIPYNVKYDRASIIGTIDKDVVIFDQSVINDYSTGGETTKHVGIVSKDAAENDTHWSIDSGHHSVLSLNNYDTANTTSSGERKATIIWNAGQLSNGTDEQKGFRGVAIRQFTKAPSQNYWIDSLRSLAPWESVDGKYERWRAGETITGTSYRVSSAGHYKSVSTGTAGTTTPTHTSGVASDGGVDWEYIDSRDRTIYQIDQHGRVAFNGGISDSLFSLKPSITDPSGGSSTVKISARNISKDVDIKLLPTNSGGFNTNIPFIRASALNGLSIRTSDGFSNIASFTGYGMEISQYSKKWVPIIDGDTSPSVVSRATLYTQNTSPTNITTLDDGANGQEVTIIALDTNTTLVSSSSFLLENSTNLTMGLYDAVTFIKVPASISNRWVEVSRSIK